MSCQPYCCERLLWIFHLDRLHRNARATLPTYGSSITEASITRWPSQTNHFKGKAHRYVHNLFRRRCHCSAASHICRVEWICTCKLEDGWNVIVTRQTEICHRLQNGPNHKVTRWTLPESLGCASKSRYIPRVVILVGNPPNQTVLSSCETPIKRWRHRYFRNPFDALHKAGIHRVLLYEVRLFSSMLRLANHDYV